jgi:hypothetical protein
MGPTRAVTSVTLCGRASPLGGRRQQPGRLSRARRRDGVLARVRPRRPRRCGISDLGLHPPRRLSLLSDSRRGRRAEEGPGDTLPRVFPVGPRLMGRKTTYISAFSAHRRRGVVKYARMWQKGHRRRWKRPFRAPPAWVSQAPQGEFAFFVAIRPFLRTHRGGAEEGGRTTRVSSRDPRASVPRPTPLGGTASPAAARGAGRPSTVEPIIQERGRPRERRIRR